MSEKEENDMMVAISLYVKLGRKKLTKHQMELCRMYWRMQKANKKSENPKPRRKYKTRLCNPQPKPKAVKEKQEKQRRMTKAELKRQRQELTQKLINQAKQWKQQH